MQNAFNSRFGPDTKLIAKWRQQQNERIYSANVIVINGSHADRMPTEIYIWPTRKQIN